MRVGRRKIRGSEYPVVQLPAEFRHWIGKTVRLVYDGEKLVLTPAKEEKEKRGD